jgi:hypothetical protein
MDRIKRGLFTKPEWDAGKAAGAKTYMGMTSSLDC